MRNYRLIWSDLKYYSRIISINSNIRVLYHLSLQNRAARALDYRLNVIIMMLVVIILIAIE